MASDNLVSYYLVSGIHLTNLVFFSKILSIILFSSLLVNVYELTKRGFNFSYILSSNSKFCGYEVILTSNMR